MQNNTQSYQLEHEWQIIDNKLVIFREINVFINL